MKEIPLTKGMVAIIDDEDYALVSGYSWYAGSTSKSKKYYAITTVGGRKNKTHVSMHRLIMNAPNGVCVDHINHNTLDNRRCNLRLCTNAQNQFNRECYNNSLSIYKGVTRRKDCNRWQAAIAVNRKTIGLGLFVNEIDAAKAYDAAALKYHSVYASTNF